MTLSDTQLYHSICGLATSRPCGNSPCKPKGSAAKKVIDRLLKQKLLQELRAKDDMPVWRRGDDNQPYTLRITESGLKAIEVGAVDGAPYDSATSGTNDVVAANPPTEANSKERPRRARHPNAKKAPLPSVSATKAWSGNPDSKQDRVVALLRQPKGATLDVLVKATGWQKHSVRGFLAGTVRKKLKLPLLSEKIDGIRTYRIGGSRAGKASNKLRSA